VADYQAKRDYEHHNAGYGAHVLAQVLPMARGLAVGGRGLQDGVEKEA
jgi:hypothetical protein